MTERSRVKGKEGIYLVGLDLLLEQGKLMSGADLDLSVFVGRSLYSSYLVWSAVWCWTFPLISPSPFLAVSMCWCFMFSSILFFNLIPVGMGRRGVGIVFRIMALVVVLDRLG